MNSDCFTLASASDRALLTAARSDDTGMAARAWQQWREATDLDALPEGQYLLLPKLNANLLRCGLADAADPRIKGVYRRTWYANQRLGELAAVALAALGQVGIPAALSGAAAVQELYGGPGERPIGQVELLVAPEDVTQAAAALGGAGWQPVRPAALLAEPGYRLWVHRAIFRKEAQAAQRPQGVDLLALAWRPLPAAPALRDAARFTALTLDAGATPPRLRREAQLLVACAHAAEGGPGRLVALADAALLLRTPLDWGLVVELAGLLAAAQPLAEALPLLEELAPAPAGPAEIAAVSNRRAALAQMAQDELPYEHPARDRRLTSRARFHLRRWRRIARGQDVALTPRSLLRYLQATAGLLPI